MDEFSVFLANPEFERVIKNCPMFSIDFLLVDGDKVLLGRRLNRPAKNFWFVPGGRVRKDESLKAAANRIARSEIGINLDYSSGQSLGVFEHFYEDSVYGEHLSTHYIAHGIKIEKYVDLSLMPNDQHDACKWWNVAEALACRDVHSYTKDYLYSGIVHLRN